MIYLKLVLIVLALMLAWVLWRFVLACAVCVGLYYVFKGYYRRKGYR